MTRRTYLDNAATSFPKPPAVGQAMARYSVDLGAPARGVYAEARQAAELVAECRRRIARLINVSSPDNIVFTLNCTDAMNMALHGAINARRRARPGQPVHVVTSTLDHNSFLRPINELARRGEVRFTRVGFDPATGLIDPDEVREAITSDTALVALLHASNVTGTVQPLELIGAECRSRDVLLLVDAAQSAGHVPVDALAMNADLVALAGHKGLLGPTGTGALYIRPGVEHRIDTVRQGGTGSRVELEHQPTDMPDRFEPGSHNTVGLVGLCEGAGWLLEQGVAMLHRREVELAAMFEEAINAATTPGLRVLGRAAGSGGERIERVAVISVVHEAIAPAELSRQLEEHFGILTRAGLHCAPLAHRALGTTRDPARLGAARFSFGPFVTEADVREAAAALKAICTEASRGARFIEVRPPHHSGAHRTDVPAGPRI